MKSTLMFLLVSTALFTAIGCASKSDSGGMSSGANLCSDDGECGDLDDCEHVSTSSQGACVNHCTSDSDCGANAVCLTGDGIGLEASCFSRCESDSQCSGGFACFQVSTGETACLPKAWNG